MVATEKYGGKWKIWWQRENMVVKGKYGGKGKIWWQRENMVAEGIIFSE